MLHLIEVLASSYIDFASNAILFCNSLCPHTPVNNIQLAQYMVRLEYVCCKFFLVKKIFNFLFFNFTLIAFTHLGFSAQQGCVILQKRLNVICRMMSILRTITSFLKDFQTQVMSTPTSMMFVTAECFKLYFSVNAKKTL